MAELRKFFARARTKSKDLADAAPAQARHVADEARRTAGAVGEVLDERTDGRFGEVVAKGGDLVDRVTATPAEARDAFREEARAETHRPQRYRPDPIDAPEPIDRPEPI